MEVVVEPKKFMDILTVARLGGELDRAQMIFEQDGVKVHVVNPAKTLGCYAKFKEGYFNSYNVEDTVQVSIPLHKLWKILRQVSLDELSIDVKGERIVFNNGAIEAPLLGYDPSIEMESRYKFVETEFGGLLVTGKVTLEKYSHARIQVPKKVNFLDVENIAFIIENNSLAIYQEDEIGHKVKKTLAVSMDKHVSDARVAVDAALMKFAFGTLIGDECHIAIALDDNGTPLPIQLCDSTNNYIVCLVVAPKLED